MVEFYGKVVAFVLISYIADIINICHFESCYGTNNSYLTL